MIEESTLKLFNMQNIHFEEINERKTKTAKSDTIASSHYVRDFYIKDFAYISPQIFKGDRNTLRSEGTCKLFARLWLREVFKGLKQFLYEGSLHGVKYIFEPSFSRKERVSWVIIMVISITICAMNIIQLVSKWTSTPFVNVIDSLPTPIWAIPFPSVVLCPHLHVQVSYSNITELKDEKLFYASRVCPQLNSEKLALNYRLNSTQNIDLQEYIKKGSPKCSDMVKNCYWRSSHGTEWFTKDCCEELLKPVFTDYGLCYAFNGLPLSGLSNSTLYWQKTFNENVNATPLEWDLDNGYPMEFPPKPNMRPFRVMASGEENGLGIDLFLNISEHQYDCDGNHIGFNILISSPTDHVYTSAVLRLPMDRMTTVEVSPITYKTDTSLRNLSPDLRQCFFQNERQLEYYEYYTDSNCKHDLLIRETKKQCDCVPFNWPREHVTSPICATSSDFKCVEEVKAKVEKQLMHDFYADSEEHRSPHEESTSCYPACNDVIYSTQVYYSDLVKEPRYSKFEWQSPRNVMPLTFSSRDLRNFWLIDMFDTSIIMVGRTLLLLIMVQNALAKVKGELTSINVHFHEDIFLGQHRHAQYDDYYFAGAIGGLLSLFLGFSIISVAELVYFVILKPIHIALKASMNKVHLNNPSKN